MSLKTYCITAADPRDALFQRWCQAHMPELWFAKERDSQAEATYTTLRIAFFAGFDAARA